MIAPIIIAVLNFLGSLGPALPSLVAEIKGKGTLTEQGAALLDKINADQVAVDALKPLPDPTPPA